MLFARLYISGLRNIEQAEINLGPGFNYLHGDNGAGKTAVLEALHVLARGRSFRATNLDQLVSRANQEMLIRAEVSTGSSLRKLGFLRRGSTNEFSVDGERGKGFATLAEHIAVQTLLPNSADLIYGAPTERRRFIDWGLFHVEHSFLQLSRRYGRTLQQRNAWLKQQPEDISLSSDPWFESLCQLGAQLNEAREAYVTKLDTPFQRALKALSVDLDIGLFYQWGGLVSLDESEKKMSESFARDVKFGSTHRGPHRAELGVYSLRGDQRDNAQEVLSRGQAKVVASAMMLAQVELQRNETDEGSVVLIDDFGAELDAEHWRRFVVMLEQLGCQVISTSTEPPENQAWLDEVTCDVFHVEHGSVRASASN